MQPTAQQLLSAVLHILGDGRARRVHQFYTPLMWSFDMTFEEINERYEVKGTQVFKERVYAALSNLSRAGLATRPRGIKGLYQITPKGIGMLFDTEERISQFVKDHLNGRSLEDEPGGAGFTSEDAIEQALVAHRDAVTEKIIKTLVKKKPEALEQISVELLQAMGYGHERGNTQAWTVTQRSRNGGIDGYIKEDILGLSRIYIQVKRYDPKTNTRVILGQVRDFAGTLINTPSKRGVIITTSDFTQLAREYVEKEVKGSISLVLIDGETLANYIYDYGLGMKAKGSSHPNQPEESVKEMDADYWNRLEDDPSAQ